MGLKISTQKSKVMKLMTNDERNLAVDGDTLESVDRFVYIRSIMCEDGDVRREIKTRKGKTSSAFNNMKKVWNSSGNSQKTILKLFNAIVTAVLLYGCESWKGLRDVENNENQMV